MRIDDVFDRSVFSNCAMKLVLNYDPIMSIVEGFSDKDFDEWEEEESCSYCEEDRPCKKHASLKRINETSRVVKITGIIPEEYEETVEGLYLSKSDMFVVRNSEEYMSLLIIDCPPFFSSENDISDMWVRKINPFSFGRSDLNLDFEIVQTIDLDEILSHKRYDCYFGEIGENADEKYIITQQIYGAYQWRLEDKHKY